MSKDELQIIVAQILFPYFPYDPFKLDNHEHFFLVRRSAAEVESPALELEDAVGFGLKELFVVQQVRELVGAIFRLGLLQHCSILF